MEIKELIDSGHLTEAISSVSEEVRKLPQDSASRNILWELLCIAGEYERADNHLDVLITQHPQASERAGLYRRVLRAAQTRLDCFYQGAKPEFIERPSQMMQAVLKALVERRFGNMADAAKILQDSSKTATPVKGKCNNKQFSLLRDCEDWCAYFLEVFTVKGKYYWIAFEDIDSVELLSPQFPIDLIWRRAHLKLKNGIDGEVFLPSIYVDTPKEYETARLGYRTDWLLEKDEPVSGIGQKLFLLDKGEIAMMEIQYLVFDSRKKV